MTQPSPNRHQCRVHSWAFVNLTECGGSDKPRVCEHCRCEGRTKEEATMVLIRDGQEVGV